MLALAAGLALPVQAQRNVTLRLNTATLPDTIRANDDIQVRGCLAGCSGDQSELPGGGVIAWNDNTTLRPDNAGGDYWTINFQIPEGQALDFKFFSTQSETQPPNGSGIGGWEDGDNLNIAAGTGDVDLELHYFNKTGGNQPYNWRPFESDDDSVAVWFRVYMNTSVAVTKGYDPSDGDLTVALRGNFGGLGGVGNGGPIEDWGGTAGSLSRESDNTGAPGYHLYSGAVRFPASAVGQDVNYKFYFQDSNTTGDTGYENGDNRFFRVPAADSTLHWVYYSNSPPVTGNVVTSTITFQVDTTPLIEIGVFDRQRGDRLQVRGDFNGFGCPDDNQDSCALTRIPGTETWANLIPVTTAAPSEIAYKFVAFTEIPNPNEPDGVGFVGWEEPLDTGGGNRYFTFEGTAEQDLGVKFFDTVRPPNVIPASRGAVDVTFRVDMSDAFSNNSDPFDPATDSVFVAFEDEIFQQTQGYMPGDLTDGVIRDMPFTREGDSNVWSLTMPIDAPTYNGIGYVIWYGGYDEAEQAFVLTREGSGGFDAGRRRYRYVMPDGSGNFPAEYTLSVDAFKVATGGTVLLPWECNPTDPDRAGKIAAGICEENGYVDAPVAVEPTGTGAPAVAALSTVFPNPTRDRAAVEYALPQAGQVTLKLYDMIGREVATVVDAYQTANTYRADFDVAGLATGVYVLRLEAGARAFTQKLTVVR